MKKSLLLAFAIMISIMSYSQYYYLPFYNAGHNPGNLNNDPEYPVGGGIASGWATVLGGSQATPAWSTLQTIPFPFMFNGDTETTYYVSSSGVLTFSDTVGTPPSHTNLILPNPTIPDKSVCIWGLAGTGSNDIIVSKTFGTAPDRQHWVHFSSYSYGGASASAWVYWSIVLEEGTNNIYIVDQRTNIAAVSLTLGLQIDDSTAFNVLGAPNISSLAGTDPTAADNTYYQFVFGTQNAFDCATQKTTLDRYLDFALAPFSVGATVFNFGTDTIQTINFNYAVNGDSTVTTLLTGLSIAMFDDVILTSGTTWNPPQSGHYDLKIWMSDINGNPDMNNLNDTLSFTVTVLDTIITKRVLVEQATGTWCQFCPDGTVVMKDILQSYPNAIGVTIHNGDSMAFPDGNIVNSAFVTGYPAGMVDRVRFDDQSAVGFSRGAWKVKTEERLGIPIPVHVSATHTYDMATRVVNITVRAAFYEDMEGDFRFNCYIVEDSLTGIGTGWNQANYYDNIQGHPMYGLGNPIIGYVHDYVTRNMLGGPWGSSGTIPSVVPKRSVYERNYTFTLPARYRPHHISLVPLVQMFSTNVNNREILNSNKYKLDYHIGMEKAETFSLLSLYPNPATDQISLDYMLTEPANMQVQVLNLTGQVQMVENLGLVPAGNNSVNINTAALAAGYYLIRVSSCNNSTVYPFIKK